MTIIGIILLILAGILLFLLEFLVVPGVTIAGIGGLLFMSGAVYLAFANFDSTTGLIVLGAVLVSIIVSLIIGLRAKTWRRISLSTAVKSKVRDGESDKVKPGMTGKTITRLAPIGTVVVEDNRYEGHSIGPYINQNTEIEVVKVAASYLIVKPKESE